MRNVSVNYAPILDGYAPANKAAAVRALVAAALFVLAELRRQDPVAAETERVRVLAMFAGTAL